MTYSSININQNITGCQNFKWKEFLYLDSLEIHTVPSDLVVDQLILTGLVMEIVRELCGDRPVVCHSVYRPFVYNKLIKGSISSYHIKGMACDFHVKDLSCDLVREILVSQLERLDLRMENKPGSNWVHIDRGVVTKNRFFKP